MQWKRTPLKVDNQRLTTKRLQTIGCQPQVCNKKVVNQKLNALALDAVHVLALALRALRPSLDASADPSKDVPAVEADPQHGHPSSVTFFFR